MTDISDKILSYVPDDRAQKVLSESKIVLIVGPTGSGKDTLKNELKKTGRYQIIVTHTNRLPRLNRGVLEQDGEPYHFVDNEQAEKMLDHKDFIEVALTHSNLYGTSIKEFEDIKQKSLIALADVDIKGVRAYRALSPNVIAIFILPPSFEVLLSRLTSRYGSSDRSRDIVIRLNTALDELQELLKADYYHAVVNEDLASTNEQVIDIVENNKSMVGNKEALDLAAQLIEDIKSYLARQI